MIHRLQRRFRNRIERLYRRLRVGLDVRHVSGPRRPALSGTGVVAVSLVRDGEVHVESFLRHHFRLGVRHVVLLDNGSVDRTVALARSFENVTVLQSSLPYGTYKYAFKQYLFDRFGRNSWCLILDIDERFDYPMSDRISLADFLGYLGQEGYTAVVAQMLDLFADGPVAGWPASAEVLLDHCSWYDHSALERRPYRPARGNRFSNPAIRFHFGGIRKSVFGVDVFLTKHPLLFGPGGARPSPASAHHCRKAYVADVSTVLYHYKFDADFRKKCLLAVARENYFRDSGEYKAYLERMDAEPELALKQPTARALRGLDPLIEDGFLAVSEAYRRFVERRGAQGGATARIYSISAGRSIVDGNLF